MAVGNEVFTGDDEQFRNSLVPAARNLHAALAQLGMDAYVRVSTANSLSVRAAPIPSGGKDSEVEPTAPCPMKPALAAAMRDDAIEPAAVLAKEAAEAFQPTSSTMFWRCDGPRPPVSAMGLGRLARHPTPARTGAPA